MEIHNISEDTVIKSVQKIFDELKNDGNPEELCLCKQCKLDTTCYVLNRIEPRYVVSNRGMTRIDQDWVERQQADADITFLVFKGLRLVNHNKRPNNLHDASSSAPDAVVSQLAFDIPTIVGKLYDGETFAPLKAGTVELRCDGQVVPMRNQNWQNSFSLVANTPGVFTFWPAPVSAETVDVNRVFEYSLKIESPDYESIVHFFKIPSTSGAPRSLDQDRTFRLPDLYLFRPGDPEQNG